MGDRIRQWCFQLAYGLALAFWFVFRPRGRGVMVAIWFDGRILIIKNAYKRCPTFPGGGPHAGETARQTAARELAEEVGLTIRPNALTWVGQYPYLDEFKRDRIDLFEIELSERPSLRIDNREVIQAEFIDPVNAQRLPLFPVAEAYLRHRAAPR